MADWYDQFNPFSGAGGIADPGGLFKTNGAPPQAQGGYYGQDQINSQMNQGYANSNVAAPQIDPAQQAQFRQMQMQQAQQLQGIASGQQQGAGELAVQRQVANAQAAQQAQARGARGGMAGMAGIQASRAQAGLGLAGAGQSQQAALGDQQMAQGQLSGVLGQGRQGDLSYGQANANLQQQQYANNNQANLGYLNQQMAQGRDQLALQSGQYNTATTQSNNEKAGLISGIAGAFVKSDERAKTDIEDGGADIDEMLSKLTAKNYRYKDENRNGAGSRVGVMVQDLERSKAGKAITLDAPDGSGYRGFDVSKAVSAALASAARLNERLSKLEGKR